MELVYTPVIAAGRALFRVMNWDVRVRGAEHIPRRGPAVIASNHVGFMDFIFMGEAARQRRRLIRFMALEEAFRHPVSGPLLRGMRHIPVDRTGEAGAALGIAVEALRRGELVGIHPESRINATAMPGAGKTGAARMAIESGAPLLPCALWGSQRLWTHGHRDLRRGVVITVDLAPPVPHAPDSNPGVITASLIGEIRRLVEQAAHTYPQPWPAAK